MGKKGKGYEKKKRYIDILRGLYAVKNGSKKKRKKEKKKKSKKKRYKSKRN